MALDGNWRHWLWELLSEFWGSTVAEDYVIAFDYFLPVLIYESEFVAICLWAVWGLDLGNLLPEHNILLIPHKSIHKLQQSILWDMARPRPKQKLAFLQLLLHRRSKMISNSKLISKNRFHIPKMLIVLPFVLLLMFIDLLEEAWDLPEENFATCVDPMGAGMGTGWWKFLYAYEIDVEMLEEKGTEHADGAAADYCDFTFYQFFFLHRILYNTKIFINFGISNTGHFPIPQKIKNQWSLASVNSDNWSTSESVTTLLFFLR